ncbi:MAG: S41 family peptidase [Gammaproteobacteria bacterium]|nr:S41 family peptidase [Gammaproteobacteria bacterium]NNF60148.1 S41 family peptidase [Gammaproteobacteria bacterium]NNM21560.1 S41 family peptidase [Gammaproteobacteria bacterium]
MSVISRGLLAVLIGVVLGVSLSAGSIVLAELEARETEALPIAEARLFAEVLERVKREYVDSVDDADLIQAAIRGMVADLDPHSAFLNSQEYREIRINTSGNYTGVGLEVNIEDGQVVVVSPIDNTPAHRAGMQPGDILMMVDGYPIEQDLEDTVARMRGEPGTPVRLTVAREGADDLLHFNLTRARIQMTSVRSAMLEPGYGYIRISQFSESTSRDLARAVLDLVERSDDTLSGIVIDLRNNPGGVLEAAVDVSDAFLDDGEIVSASGRAVEADFSMTANPGDISRGARLAVLINSGTASASEIVAGALQDHDRAVLLGSRSFGKGSVQTVMPLSDGRAIKLTTSRYFTPSGRSIHESGIMPDVELETSGSDAVDASRWLQEATTMLADDYQLRQALTHLKGGEIRQSAAQ